MSYEAVADGELATVVTYLQMTEWRNVDSRSSGDCASTRDCPLSLQRLDHPEVDHYRNLFRRVGARWLWFSRLAIDDAELSAIIRDPKVELYAVLDEGRREVGMLELDFRAAGECELAFVGLVPELSGQGHGRWLLAEAVTRAWGDGVRRVHVHTCSLDHPAALSAYRRAGFSPCKRAIERFPDPRLVGLLPIDCAPQVPVLGTPARVAPPES